MLEKAVIKTVENGIMTKDLAICVHGLDVHEGKHFVYTEPFLDAVKQQVDKDWVNQ